MEKSKLDNENLADAEALKVIGKTEKQLRNKKQTQKQFLEIFVRVEKIENKFIGLSICIP